MHSIRFQRLRNGTSLAILSREHMPETIFVCPKPEPLATVRLMRGGKFVTPPIPTRPPWRKP
jgi:hypothetical protein